MDPEYDVDALADQLLGTMGNQNDPAPVEGEGEPPSEPVEAEPTNPTSTPSNSSEDLDRYYQARREQEQQVEARTASQAELQKLIEAAVSGDEEAATTLGKNLAQEYQSQTVAQQVQDKAVSEYTSKLFTSIFTPAFVSSLTPEEKATLDPDKFDSDESYLDKIIEVKAAKATKVSEDEIVERRVKEALEAEKNTQRGQLLKQTSVSASPVARPGEDNASKTGRDLMVEAFAELRESATGLGV